MTRQTAENSDAVIQCERLRTLMTLCQALRRGAKTVSGRGNDQLSSWLEQQAEILAPVIQERVDEASRIIPPETRPQFETRLQRAGYSTTTGF